MSRVMRFTVLVLCISAALAQGGYTLEFSKFEFNWHKENGFDRVNTGDYALVGEPGVPELPALYLNYIVPVNAMVESVVVTDMSIYRIPGSFRVFPAQPVDMICETAPWVPPDAAIYNSSELFPGSFVTVVGEGIMDGARIVTLEVRPLQYTGKTNRLFLAERINFEFVLTPTTLPSLRPRLRGAAEQNAYDAALRRVVVNDEEIAVFYQRPASIGQNKLLERATWREFFAPAVIITPADFFDAFQPYVDWLTEQGTRAILLSPVDIYQHWSGVDEAECVRNYLKDCYAVGGTYVILGGDEDEVPVRYAYSPPTWDEFLACDLYFSDLTGDWDSDSDGVWGEWKSDNPDRYPEVFVGRIPVRNVGEVNNWVAKALNYEKTPGILLNNALWIEATDCWPSHSPPIFPEHFRHFFAKDYGADAVLCKMNEGYAFVNTHCHGDVTDFRCRPAPSEAYILSFSPNVPNASKSGLNWLTNVGKYSVAYSTCCFTAAYGHKMPSPYVPSDTCIADAFLDAYSDVAPGNPGPVGACAYLGNTGRGLRPASYDLQYEFYDLILHPWSSIWTDEVTRIGIAEALSKCGESMNWYTEQKARYICYCHNLFGSPYFEAWTDTPGTLSVSHPTYIPVDETTQLTVSVRNLLSGEPLEFARVCLHKPDDIYITRKTDYNGRATFSITPQTIGSMKVTVTRLHYADNNYSQYLPSQTICSVVRDARPGGHLSERREIRPEELCMSIGPPLLEGDARITFGVPVSGQIMIAIYNIAGVCVDVIEKGVHDAGYYSEVVVLDRLAAGVYFIVLRQEGQKVTEKIILLK